MAKLIVAGVTDVLVMDGLPDPDAVFVGGSGGHLNEILVTVGVRLKTGGRVVVKNIGGGDQI